jgi:hypothetical protein
LQAANSGGFDFVLLHPEYLRDRTGGSLLVALRNNNVKMAAYGYEPQGFARELIEGAGIAHYIPGPTAAGLDMNLLGTLVATMQSSAVMGGIPVSSQWPLNCELRAQNTMRSVDASLETNIVRKWARVGARSKASPNAGGTSGRVGRKATLARSLTCSNARTKEEQLTTEWRNDGAA